MHPLCRRERWATYNVEGMRTTLKNVRLQKLLTNLHPREGQHV